MQTKQFLDTYREAMQKWPDEKLLEVWAQCAGQSWYLELVNEEITRRKVCGLIQTGVLDRTQ